MSNLKKWQLLEAKDVSPSPYFPLEKRKYRRPDGTVVDDFYVTTLKDSVHIIPITTDGKIILIRMYKQGVDDFVIQFPAGRFEFKHNNLANAALMELEEETGIKVNPNDLLPITKFAVMTTKSSEYTHLYIAKNVTFNSQQKLDDNEEIEIIVATPQEVDQMIDDNQIIEGLMIADWYIAKRKFFNLL